MDDKLPLQILEYWGRTLRLKEGRLTAVSQRRLGGSQRAERNEPVVVGALLRVGSGKSRVRVLFGASWMTAGCNSYHER